VITRRGWWLVLEPAMLAFTVVVCGSVALLANSHASASVRDHQYDTSGSDHTTVSAILHDSVDDGDDNDDDDDDVGNALPAAPINLTSDGSHDGPRVQTYAPLSLLWERLSSRGPPSRDHRADTSGSSRATVMAACRVSVDDSDDDDDDDDDAGNALLVAPTVLTSDESHDGPRVQTHVPSSLRFERLSSRGPPRVSPDRIPSSWTAGDSERHRQNSSNDDVDDDDDDDDDDDSSEASRSSRVSDRAQTWILIQSELRDPASSASVVHSLRAPPQ